MTHSFNNLSYGSSSKKGLLPGGIPHTCVTLGFTAKSSYVSHKFLFNRTSSTRNIMYTCLKTLALHALRHPSDFHHLMSNFIRIHFQNSLKISFAPSIQVETIIALAINLTLKRISHSSWVSGQLPHHPFRHLPSFSLSIPQRRQKKNWQMMLFCSCSCHLCVDEVGFNIHNVNSARRQSEVFDQ